MSPRSSSSTSSFPIVRCHVPSFVRHSASKRMPTREPAPAPNEDADDAVGNNVGGGGGSGVRVGFRVVEEDEIARV